MANIIICIVLVAICVYAVLAYKKKLNSGCCGSGGGEVKIKPADNVKSHYKYEADVYIDGMTCQHCKQTVENAFNSCDKFWANVNLRKKMAEVLSKEAIDESEIRAIVEKAGYQYIKTEVK